DLLRHRIAAAVAAVPGEHLSESPTAAGIDGEEAGFVRLFREAGKSHHLLCIAAAAVENQHHRPVAFAVVGFGDVDQVLARDALHGDGSSVVAGTEGSEKSGHGSHQQEGKHTMDPQKRIHPDSTTKAANFGSVTGSLALGRPTGDGGV